MTSQCNRCLTYHLSLWTLGFKPLESVVLWHLNLEMWYKLIMTLSCDKRPLSKKRPISRTATFCLSKSPAFCFETACGRCVTERRTLQIFFLNFSSVSSFVMLLCTRSWNSSPYPYLTWSYWVSSEERLCPYLLSGYVGQVVRCLSGPPAVRLWTQIRKAIVLALPQDICFSQLICGTKLRPCIKSVAGGVSKQTCKFLYHFH